MILTQARCQSTAAMQDFESSDERASGGKHTDREGLAPGTDTRDPSVSAVGISRGPTVPLGPTALTRIVLCRRWGGGGRHISLLFLKRRYISWLRLGVSDRSFRNWNVPFAWGACTCSETSATDQAARLRCR